tara:strand:- start:63 stop:1433 length:1371 start_codon:yes stop_codon:yes gene_type:complete
MISLEPSAARDIAVDAKRCSKSNWRNLSGFAELAPHAVWGSDQELAVAIGYMRSTAKNVKAKLIQYGHVWTTIDTFYRCVVRQHIWASRNGEAGGEQARLTVFIPSMLNVTKRFSMPNAFEQLQVLLGGAGSGVTIQRAPWVPICGAGSKDNPYLHDDPPTCCLGGGCSPQTFRGKHVLQLMIDEGAAPEAPVEELRRVVWANIDNTTRGGQQPSRIVLFASSNRPSNRRHIQDETKVAEACRAYFAAKRPELTFVHQRLEDLPYVEELRLMGRATVFIALFGSGLHNCRFLPRGAVVVELRGAMGHEYINLLGYSNLCTHAGHRWLGFAAKNAAPIQVRWEADRRAYDFKFENRHDPSTARFDGPALVARIDAAMNGDWPSVLGAYVREASAWALPNASIAYLPSFRTSWLSRMLAKPQYKNQGHAPTLQSRSVQNHARVKTKTLSGISLDILGR